MPPSFFSPDTTWTGTQILLSEQHCTLAGPFVRLMSSDEVCEALGRTLEPC